jgi:hypothetical protein
MKKRGHRLIDLRLQEEPLVRHYFLREQALGVKET